MGQKAFAQFYSARTIPVMVLNGGYTEAEVSESVDTATERTSNQLVWRLPPDEEGLQAEKEHGTRVVFSLKGRYQTGRQSVREYLRTTSIVNPHATISFTDPAGEVMRFDRASDELPQLPQEGIKPHPHGVELGQLLRMAHHASQHQLGLFLQQEFSSMGKRTIENVLARAALDPVVRPQDITRAEALALREAFQTTSIRSPTSKVLVPIGPQLIKLGLKQVLEELRPDYYTTPVSRAPAVFAGTPFHGDRGDELLDEDSPPGDDFFAGVVRDWEAACEPALAAGIRVVNPDEAGTADACGFCRAHPARQPGGPSRPCRRGGLDYRGSSRRPKYKAKCVQAARKSPQGRQYHQLQYLDHSARAAHEGDGQALRARLHDYPLLQSAALPAAAGDCTFTDDGAGAVCRLPGPRRPAARQGGRGLQRHAGIHRQPHRRLLDAVRHQRRD